VAGQSSGAIPWVLDGGTAGVLVDINSPTELAKGILGLIDDEAQRNALVSRAFSNVSERFGIEHVVELYEHQYLAALEAAK
jgi:glycosyltransferase involved in cell wall biosynthesis